VKQCILRILDEINVSFINLDAATRRQCHEALKYFMPHARHTPAFKLGRWDGTASFFAINGNTYIYFLEKILPIIENAGYEIELEDLRTQYHFTFPKVTEDFLTKHAPNAVWPKGHNNAGEPILLRDYQVQSINDFIANPHSIGLISTGAGKTITTATLSLLCEPHGRTIVIVPNKDLVKQTEADYKLLGMDVGVYFGERKELGHTHTICTWQSLDKVAKGTAAKTKTSQVDFEDFIENVVAVIVDEIHGAKGDVLRNMLAGAFANIPLRWGFTGTIPKEEYNADIIYSTIGPVVTTVKARELMDRGVLSDCHVQIVQMKDYVEFDNYAEEYNYLVTDQTKLYWMSTFIKEMADIGNTLILVNRVATGKELQKLLPGSEFVSGGVKSDDRQEAYDSIAVEDGKMLIATYGVAAVGLNIPRLFNLILFEPGKSFVRVIQSIGRGVRRAKDKDFVQIYDIASTCKF
jgi:superfamily II DNA or RNA helicase